METTDQSGRERRDSEADSAVRPGAGNRVVGSAAVVLVMLLLGRLAGLLRDLIVAPLFGAGVEVDALVAARTVPDLILTLVTAGAVSAGILPGLSYLSGGGDRLSEDGVRAISVIANWLVVGAVAFALLGGLAPHALIALVTPGLGSEAEVLAGRLLRLMAPVIVLVTVAALLSAHFNFRGRFALPSARAMVTNLTIVVLTLGLARQLGVAAVAVGWTLGALVQVGLMAAASRRLDIQYRVAFDLRSPHVAYLWQIMLPVVLSQVLLYGRFLVERQFASWLPAGALAYLNYGYRIGTAPMLIVANAITTVYLPLFSRQVARDDPEAFKASIIQSVSMLLLGISPFLTVFVVLPQEVVSLLLQHGAFGAADSAATADLLRIYTLTLVASSLLALLSQILYAQRRGVRALVAIAVGIAVQVGLTAWLVGSLGVEGVALGTGLGLVASVLVLLLLLAPGLPQGLWAALGPRCARIGVAAVAMGLTLYGTSRLVEGPQLVLAALAGGLAYLLVLELLRLPELEVVHERARRVAEWFVPW